MDDWKDSSVSTVLPTRTWGLAHVKKYNKKEELHIKYFGNWYKPSAREADMERFRDFLVSQPISLDKC